MSDVIFLNGERVLLRPLTKNDLTPVYLQWLNDEEVTRFNSHATFPNTQEKMEGMKKEKEKEKKKGKIESI